MLRLIKVWSDEKADYEYILQWWWEFNWFERFLHGADGMWTDKGRGGLYWAQKIAQHYELTIPNTITEDY